MRALLVVVVLIVYGASAQADEPLKVGVAVREITPPIGYRMSGYFYERPSTGVHDPLYAKALVLEQGETRAALVFCDLIGISRTISDKARKLASEQTKIPAENILIAATHSHTGPLYAGALRDHWHAQAVVKHGEDPAEAMDYPAELVKDLADVVAAAQKHARPARLNVSTNEQAGLSFNRRFHMKDGSVRFNPGRNNPDIVRVAGPIDPQVQALAIWPDDGGKALALLAVFALHLDTVGGTEYSADYPQYLSRELQNALGDQCISLFGAGTCGDINHIDVTKADQPKGQKMAEHIGTQLAKTIVSGLPKSEPVKAPSLAVKSSSVRCPVQKYSEKEVSKAVANFPKIGGKELTFLEQVETYKIVALQSLPKDALPLEVQVFRLSDDAAIVGLPGEVFVELGLAIKDRSPFKQTLVIELCNDAPGYIPTKKAFAEGSYETVNSRVAPGGGELLVEEAVKLLKELKP